MLAVLVMALVLGPIGSTLVRVFYDGEEFTLDTFRDVFSSNSLYEILLNTLIVVVLGSVCAFVVGSLFAWLNQRTDARVPWIGDLLPNGPLMIPAIAVAIGWVSCSLAAPADRRGAAGRARAARLLGAGGPVRRRLPARPHARLPVCPDPVRLRGDGRAACST